MSKKRRDKRRKRLLKAAQSAPSGCDDCYQITRCAEHGLHGRCREYKSLDDIRKEVQNAGSWFLDNGGLIMALQAATLAYMLHRRRIEVHKRKRRAAHLKRRRFPISADWDRIMRDTTITGIKTAEGSKEEA